MFQYDCQCDRCGAMARVTHARLLRYRLDDGTEIPGTDLPVWCFSCKCASAGEAIPEVGHFEETLRRFEEAGIDDDDKDGARFTRRDPAASHAEKLQRWRAGLRWRTARRSPPRCLKCGSVSITSLSFEDDSFEHPECGGRFRVVHSCHAYQGWFQVLTSEGLPWSEDERLPKEHFVFPIEIGVQKPKRGKVNPGGPGP